MIFGSPSIFFLLQSNEMCESVCVYMLVYTHLITLLHKQGL